MTLHTAHNHPNHCEPSRFPVIAATHWGENTVYVRDTPRKIKVGNKYAGYKLKPMPGFADWEYTDDRSKAMELSRYWWRRFRADRHYCNQCAHWEETR